VLGPLAAFLLMPYLTTATGSTEGAYRTIFWLSFIPGLLSVAMLYLIKEKAAKMQREKKTSFSKALGPQFKRFLIVTVVFGLGMFSYSFMILRAQEVGVNVNLIPLLYLSFNVSYMFFAMPFGTHSDKIGRKRVLAMGYISFALLSAGLIYSKTTFHVWTMFMLYGLFMAIMETVQRAYISDVVKAEVRGTAFGLHQGATGFAALPANLIAGTLWSMYGSAAAFTYSITVTAAALVLLAATVEEKRS